MKAVFCDLDETLLVNWHVPEINSRAIQKMRDAGHLFIPCTGRPPFMMEDILEELEIKDQPGEYFVSFNGGMVLEAKNNKVLYYNGLTYEEAATIIQIAENYNFCTMVVTNERFHILNPIASEVDRKTRQATKFALYDTYDPEQIPALRTETIGKVMFVTDDGVDSFRKIVPQLPAEVLENYEISFSSGRFMEFNKKGVTKGNALQFLAEYLQIDLSDTIAIGDSFNDLSMIEQAGTGACVSSADEEVKMRSDYICERDYTEGAVAEVIEKMLEGSLRSAL